MEVFFFKPPEKPLQTAVDYTQNNITYVKHNGNYNLKNTLYFGYRLFMRFVWLLQ
jgi:hypothetical protein